MKNIFIAFAIFLASCSTTTTVTVQRPDGKIVTTVTEKTPPSDGVITTITNALLGGFLTIFKTEQP